MFKTWKKDKKPEKKYKGMQPIESKPIIYCCVCNKAIDTKREDYKLKTTKQNDKVTYARCAHTNCITK